MQSGHIFKVLSSLIVMPVILLYSCRKEKLVPPAEVIEMNTEMLSGLPSDLTRVNGYFYVQKSHSPYNTANFARSATVHFSVHGGDLRKGHDRDLDILEASQFVGDLMVGTLRLDTLRINGWSLTGPRYYYSGVTYSAATVDSNVVWRFTGAGSIPADSFKFKNPFPIIKSLPKSLVVSVDSSFLILIDSVLGNFTDGAIMLTGDHYRGGPYVSVKFPVSSEMRHFYLTAQQVNSLLTPSGGAPPNMLRFKGYNYYHKYHRGKLYVFTFASRVDYSIKRRY
jgi:hypothetical protein